MGRNLILMLRKELGNLDKDPESRRAAMKALTASIEELDSRSVPLFLAQVSETKEPDSSSVAECKLSLLEVLARVHGRSIVLHIDSITSMIMETMLSSAGSFALLQACSKVVPAIAHHVIDPSAPDDDKKREIISVLCTPFSDCLMGPQQSVTSGAALCLRALVESDCWRFASDELVNEVCLKVAGALEEKQTQMNSHLGLVMALLEHNALVVEAFARSLVRSGLHIVNAGANESASQRRLSAIQMINFLMKRVDSRSIFSEITSIVDVMGRCQNEDRMAYVRGAAFEALQTAAKMVAAPKGSAGYERVSSRPSMGSNADRTNNESNSWAAKDHVDKRSGGSAQVPSPESRDVDDFVDYDASVDSPFSVEQSSCDFVRARRAGRRRRGCDFGVVDETLGDGCFCKAGSGGGGGGPVIHFKQSRDGGGLREGRRESSETMSEIGQSRTTYMETRAIAPTAQISRLHLIADNVKVDSAAQKLQRYHQNSSNPRLEDPERECSSRMPTSRTLDEVRWNHAVALIGNDIPQNWNSEVKRRKNHESKRNLDNQQHIQDADFVMDSTNSVSSVVDEDHADSAAGCEDGNGIQILRKRSICCTAGLGFFCCLCVTFLAVILSEWWIDDEEFSYVVPT